MILLFKGFHKIFRRFYETPAEVEAVGVGSPGMAVYFDPVTLSLTGQGGDVVFQFGSDAKVAGVASDSEIADPCKIAGQCDLGDEVEGKEGDHFGILFVDEQDFVGVIG